MSVALSGAELNAEMTKTVPASEDGKGATDVQIFHPEWNGTYAVGDVQVHDNPKMPEGENLLFYMCLEKACKRYIIVTFKCSYLKQNRRKLT